MKKLLSLILAMLMLAMPVFSGAEEAAVSTSTAMLQAAAQQDFATKYVLQGQEEIVDLNVEISDLTMSMTQVPADQAAMVKELLNAIGFRVTFQTAENQAQGGLALLLGGDEAVNAKVAYADKNLYAASNLLGDKIVQVTGPQVKQLVNQLIDQAVADGKISQENVDSLKKFYREFREDPISAIMKLIGQPDFQPLMAALQSFVMNVKTEEVTEAPEAFPAAKNVLIVPITKEGLDSVLTELAKVIWSMPVTQKLASMAKEGPKTEDEMIAAFTKASNALAEDAEVRVYLDDTGMNYYITGDVKVAKDGETKAISYCQLIQVMDNGMHMEMQVSMDSGEKVNGVMDMTMADGQANMTYHITSEDMQNGVAYQPVEEIISMNVATTETSKDVTMDVTMRIKENPDAEQVGMVMKAVANETDLGDHAEGQGTFTTSMEGIGDLMTITINKKTDIAEAYIITPDAVQPIAMSEEELNAFGQEISSNAMMVLISVLPKLPQGLQQMLMGQ